MKFGKSEKTRIIDQQGSTQTTITNYRNGEVMQPIRHRYEIREPARDLDTIIQEASKFFEETFDPKTKKLDACIKLEATPQGRHEGAFYIVKCYTVLEY